MSDVDVVVAGAGGAGLTAALAAADAGCSVALIEWKEQFRHGNNTSMSTAMVPAAGSRWQRTAGIPDSPAVFLSDIMAKTKGSADPIIAQALVDAAPALVDWLADDCGLPLGLVTDFNYPGHTYPRCHTVPDRAGSSLLGFLLDRVRAHPLIETLIGARVVEVLTAAPSGVHAAVLRHGDGTSEQIHTSAVVMATGGFGADPSMVQQLIPEIAGGLYFGGDGCRGDALRIARQLGADLGYLDAYQGHGSVAVPHGVLTTWATVMHGAIIVNTAGRRFGDETTGYSEYARMVLDQPGEAAWLILDRRIDAACQPFKDYQDLVTAQAVKFAPDTVALATQAGIDVAGLTVTLQDVRAVARGQQPDEFGRTGWEQPLSDPLAYVRIAGALFHTQGGALVDGHARVLRHHAPIPGLFAAGGAAAGISGHGPGGYLAGNGLLAALGLGFLAGAAVREHASPPGQ